MHEALRSVLDHFQKRLAKCQGWPDESVFLRVGLDDYHQVTVGEARAFVSIAAIEGTATDGHAANDGSINRAVQPGGVTGQASFTKPIDTIIGWAKELVELADRDKLADDRVWQHTTNGSPPVTFGDWRAFVAIAAGYRQEIFYMARADRAESEARDQERLAAQYASGLKEALVALAGSKICTPEKGFTEEPYLLGPRIVELRKQRDALLDAIREHHDQKADDRCIEDDTKLYAVAGLEPADHHVGDPEAMLANCARFIKNRCQAGKWPNYVDLERQLAEANASLITVRGQCIELAATAGRVAELEAKVAEMQDRVDVTRESRDDAHNRAAEKLQAEMASLRAENARLRTPPEGQHAALIEDLISAVTAWMHAGRATHEARAANKIRIAHGKLKIYRDGRGTGDSQPIDGASVTERPETIT